MSPDVEAGAPPVVCSSMRSSAFIAAMISGGPKSLADLGIKGADALVRFLKNEGPMGSRVLASWTESALYVIALEFVNTTIHGSYVESLAVTKPGSNFDFDVALPERKRKEAGVSFSPGHDDRRRSADR